MSQYTPHLFKLNEFDIGSLSTAASDFAVNNPHYMYALGIGSAPIYDYLKGKFKKHTGSVIDKTAIGKAYEDIDNAVDNTFNAVKDTMGVQYSKDPEFEKFRQPIRSMVKDEVSTQLKGYNLKPNSTASNMPTPNQPSAQNGKTAVGTNPTPPPAPKPAMGGNGVSTPKG